MANYADPKHLQHHPDAPAFKPTYAPGTITPVSGIYRCVTCGDEIAANKSEPLPPQNEHQHPPGGDILWKLLVAAVQIK